jgi:pyruvate/2-oxoglutarate dehydrogenase complex dihydrolipoamide acyltransferase (E2) component
MNILRLPDLGASTGEAEVVVWLKAVGERITVGEPVLKCSLTKQTLVEATISAPCAGAGGGRADPEAGRSFFGGDR